VIYQIPVFYDTSLFPSVIYTNAVSSLGIPIHFHSIEVSEKIVSISQINQLTGTAASHNHAIINGVVEEVLGHTHSIIL
jgi:hypothetical protein